MVNLLNYVQWSGPISWKQANAVAMSLGQRLFFDDGNHDQSLKAHAEYGNGAFEESYKWIGVIYQADGTYAYTDGTAVTSPKADGLIENNPNLDSDPSNDNPYVTLTASTWHWPYPGASDVSQFVIEYDQGSRFVGTAVNDFFFGALKLGQVLLAGSGNDNYRGPGGGTIVLGDGNDYAELGYLPYSSDWFRGGGETTVLDGAGSDYIAAGAFPLIIKAAIDGDDDTFAGATRVSYADDRMGISNLATWTPGSDSSVFEGQGIGNDTLQGVYEITGGSGNDYIAGSARVSGGAGNDFLQPGFSYAVSPRYLAEGGDGDDTMVADIHNPDVLEPTVPRVDMRGGNGDDTLVFRTGATSSGGAGADTFVFESADIQVTINDLAAGDRIDLSQLFESDPGSAAIAIDQGYLKTTVSRGYTYIQFDADGGSGNFVDLIALKGVYQDITDYLII